MPLAAKCFIKKYYYKFVWIYFHLKYKARYKTTDFFSHVDIEICSACNRRCKYCPNYKFGRGLLKNQTLMPEKIFKKIIDELAEVRYNGMITPSVYNEPLLDKRLVRLLTYAREKLPKAKILIVSNGDYLTPKLYQELVDAGTTEFLITEHGKSMSKNMKATFKYIKENKLKNRIIYRKFTKDTALYNRGGTIEHETITQEAPCNYPLSPIVINYKGEVILCCNDYFGEFVYGNVAKESLIKIWNKPNYKKMREEIKKEIYRLPICKKCVGKE